MASGSQLPLRWMEMLMDNFLQVEYRLPWSEPWEIRGEFEKPVWKQLLFVQFHMVCFCAVLIPEVTADIYKQSGFWAPPPLYDADVYAALKTQHMWVCENVYSQVFLASFTSAISISLEGFDHCLPDHVSPVNTSDWIYWRGCLTTAHQCWKKKEICFKFDLTMNMMIQAECHFNQALVLTESSTCFSLILIDHLIDLLVVHYTSACVFTQHVGISF